VGCEKHDVGFSVDDDDALLVRFKAGEPDAFVAFYRRHMPAVLTFLRRRAGDPELAADLTAEVFAAALIAAARYVPGERPALAWLYGIASHKLVDSRRRGRVEDEARRRLGLDPLVIDDADLAWVEETVSAGSSSSALEDAVDALPDEQRAAVVARVVDEQSYSEIAARMQCSEMLVRQRVSRGLRALRTKLKESPE
jgi:RNA polymerase sigma factor (sigma-70 family)